MEIASRTDQAFHRHHRAGGRALPVALALALAALAATTLRAAPSLPETGAPTKTAAASGNAAAPPPSAWKYPSQGGRVAGDWRARERWGEDSPIAGYGWADEESSVVIGYGTRHGPRQPGPPANRLDDRDAGRSGVFGLSLSVRR